MCAGSPAIATDGSASHAPGADPLLLPPEESCPPLLSTVASVAEGSVPDESAWPDDAEGSLPCDVEALVGSLEESAVGSEDGPVGLVVGSVPELVPAPVSVASSLPHAGSIAAAVAPRPR